MKEATRKTHTASDYTSHNSERDGERERILVLSQAVVIVIRGGGVVCDKVIKLSIL